MVRTIFTVLTATLVTVSLMLVPLWAEEGDRYSNISSALDAETAILIYDTKNLSVMVITADGATAVNLPSTDEPVEIKINFFKDSVERVDTLAPFQDEANALYKILIAPIRGTLAGITRLGIVPGPDLSELSFAALVSERDTKNVFMPRPHFLLDDFAIFYAPSVESMEAALLSGESTEIGGVIIGNAYYPASFPRLKVAPIEMKEVAEQLPGAVMIEKDMATESALKEELSRGAMRVVHMTTHSVIKRGSNTESKLLFTGGGGEDGNLTISEVLELSIDVDLVTISADDAGITWGSTGGFPGAFLVSGAHSVIAPVWNIDRGVTSMLMDFFYENLNTTDKAEALRLAQEMVIDFEKEKGYRRLAHPGFWAPFLLYGSYR
jgi:CHAT domain-containing protein